MIVHIHVLRELWWVGRPAEFAISSNFGFLSRLESPKLTDDYLLKKLEFELLSMTTLLTINISYP